MAYAAKILRDSVSPDGVRLTTLEVTIPRIVLSEFNTHRVFSRNSSSSRAIPIEKMLRRVFEDPFIPTYWGKNQKGMQAERELSEIEQHDARYEWLSARDHAIKSVKAMLEIGVHKQITNRLLEPWLWQTIIVTATEWDNFFALRCHSNAQPEIRKAAEMMREAMKQSSPSLVRFGTWHLPLLEDEDQLLSEGFSQDELLKISAGRCARISYLTHDGKRDPRADVELADSLLSNGHMSPFEHVARPLDVREAVSRGLLGATPFVGNFRGWVQYRKVLPNEDNFARTCNAG